MQNLSRELPLPVSRGLTRQARRGAVVLAGNRLALAALLLLALLLVSLTVDRLVELPGLVKLALPLLTLVVPLAVLASAAARLLRRRDAERVAARMDATLAGARDAIRSAVNLQSREDTTPGTVNPYLLQAVRERASERVAQVRPAAVTPWGPLRWRALSAVLLAAVFAGLCFWPPMCMGLLLQRFVAPLGNHPRPSLTRIAVQAPLEQRVPQGEDVAVAVVVSGAAPADGRCSLTVERGGQRDRILMSPLPGGRYATVLKAVQQSLAFRVESGDGCSARYAIAVDPRPEIQALRVRYDYPRYTRLAAAEEELRYRELKGVAGTRVRLEFTATLPVRSGFAEFADRRIEIRWDRTRTRGSLQFTIETETSFAIALESENGVASRGDTPFRVRLVPDNPPTVSLIGMPETLTFYREDVLPITYRGSDDFGIDEVFVRYRSGDERTPRSWSLDMARANVKEVEGQTVLELRQFAGEDDATLDFELVMVDNKGQEAATPRIELQIVSDTPDRQLAQLIGYEARFLDSLDQNAGRLSGQASRLDILLEGMEAATALDGKRAEMFNGIAGELANVRLDDVTRLPHWYRDFAYAEYPPLSQRQAESAFAAVPTFRAGSAYTALAEATRAQAAPRAAIVALRQQVAADGERVRALAEAFSDVLLETRLRLVDCLAESALRGFQAAASSASGGEKDDLVRARQEEKVARVLAEWKDIGKRHAAGLAALPPSVGEAFTSLGAAMEQPREKRATALVPALTALQGALADDPAGGGVLGQKLLAYNAKYPVLGDGGNPTGGVPGSAFPAMLMLLRFRRDDLGADDADMFRTLRVFEGILSGDASRQAAALAAYGQLDPWARRCSLVERARQLQGQARALELDLRIGRLARPSAALDRRWQEMRELFLSLLVDAKQGTLAGLGADEDLARLAQDRALFRRWTAAAALGDQAAAGRKLAELCTVLDGLAKRQEPAMASAAAGTAAECTTLLRDVLAALAKDLIALRQEIEAIGAETADAQRTREYRGKILTEAEWRTKFARNASPERQAFAGSIADRMLLHNAAFHALADRVTPPWFARPDAAKMDGVLATAALGEYLSHIEEDVYEQAVQPYLLQNTQGARPFPEFVIAVGEYYGRLQESLTRLQGWLTAYAEGRSSEPLADPALLGDLRRLRKNVRYEDAARAVHAHAEWMAVWGDGSGTARRPEALRLLRESTLASFSLWEQVAWPLDELLSRAGVAIASQDAAGWKGVDPAVAQALSGPTAVLRGLLSGEGQTAVELQGLPAWLDELPALAARSAPATVAALAADARANLLDDWQDWHGRGLALRRGMDLRLTVPAVKIRPRTRYTAKFRMDLMNIESLLIRGETRWAERLAAAGRGVWLDRAWAAAGGDHAPGPAELAWVAWQEEAVRRKTAASLAQAGRALQLDTEGVDERFLNMPKYLYEELMRASTKPYPTDFRDAGTYYIRELVKAAR